VTDFAMTPKENKAFFKAFGSHLARLRKESGITQVQLAETLGYSQQQIASFESGRRRIPLSAIPPLLEALGISFEELVGIERATRRRRKRGPPSKIEQQLEKLSKLPKAKQRFVSEMLDGLIQQAS